MLKPSTRRGRQGAHQIGQLGRRAGPVEAGFRFIDLGGIAGAIALFDSLRCRATAQLVRDFCEQASRQRS